jgi:hypothetical protein
MRIHADSDSGQTLKQKKKKLKFCMKNILKVSVADPGCLSRIPDPDFYPSRIPNLGSRIQKQEQKRGVKKICCHTFVCSLKFHKFHKIVNYFIFEMLKK